MSDAATIVGAAGVACSITALMTPIAIRVARWTNFYDHPAGYKKHSVSTPYLGGLAVAAGVLAAFAVFSPDLDDLAVLIGCAGGLVALGTLDDRLGLGIGIRLVAQVTTGLVIWEVGLGWDILGSETADFSLTLIWVVGLINAFNLFDNIDGAAATVGGAGAAGVAVLAAAQGDVALGAAAIAVTGACAGFLFFNLARPSRIFLGDGGSMPLGLMLATLIMAAPAADLGWASLPAYALLVALPILDTTLVVISRLRRGVGIFDGGRDHLTHRLLTVLRSPRRVAAALGLTQLALCGLAIALAEMNQAVVVAAATPVFIAGAWLIRELESPRWMPMEREHNRARGERLVLGEKGSA